MNGVFSGDNDKTRVTKASEEDPTTNSVAILTTEGKLKHHASVTETEISTLNGADSNIQNQLDALLSKLEKKVHYGETSKTGTSGTAVELVAADDNKGLRVYVYYVGGTAQLRVSNGLGERALISYIGIERVTGVSSLSLPNGSYLSVSNIGNVSTADFDPEYIITATKRTSTSTTFDSNVDQTWYIKIHTTSTTFHWRVIAN